MRVSDGVALSGFDNRFPIGTDLAPRQSVMRVITLESPAPKGNYRLEVDLVQEAVTWFSSKGTKRSELLVYVPEPLADDAYSAVIVPKCIVCTVVPRRPLRVQVTITNVSARLWPQEGIALSTRFVRVSDGAALSGFNNRFSIGSDIAPHQSRQYTVTLESPAAAGDYRLEVDLVHEMVTWFSNKHTKRGELPIHIDGAFRPN